MPSPKECGSKFPAGSKAYKDCVDYKTNPNKSKKMNPSKKMGKMGY